MKKLKKFIWILLAAVMITVGTACTENPTPGPGPGEGTGTVKSGTINIFLPIDTDTSNALRAVGNAYTKMMGQKGIKVQVKSALPKTRTGTVRRLPDSCKIPKIRRAILFRQTSPPSFTVRINWSTLRPI